VDGSSRSDSRRRLVVLLGAGASVEAGLLTSRDLTEKIYNDIAARRGSEYALILGYVIAKLKTRNAKIGKSPYEPIEVEELFDALSILFRRDQSLLSEFVERWDTTIAEHFVSYDTNAIERALEAIVSRIVQRSSRGGFSLSGFSSDFSNLAKALQPKSSISQPTNRFYDPQQPFFDALIKNLSVDPAKLSYLYPLLQSDEIALIATLNYDLGVETAAGQIGKEIDYGLDHWQRMKRVEWNRKPSIRLLKLHGSINWTGAAENVKVSSVGVEDRERRVMIFGGTENKLSSAGPFLQFLYRFERSLFTSGRLLVVGYSFRDPHINAVLRRWYLTRNKAEIAIINPTPPNLWEVGFAPTGGELSLGGGRKKRLQPVRFIEEPASEGIRQFFDQPTLALEAAQ
jgi:hypothetical protein